MDAILSNLVAFLCSLDGAALVIAVIVALAIPIFVGIMAIIGAWRIRQKGFRSGIFMIIPLILLGGALLWVNYKANGNS